MLVLNYVSLLLATIVVGLTSLAMPASAVPKVFGDRNPISQHRPNWDKDDRPRPNWDKDDRPRPNWDKDDKPRVRIVKPPKGDRVVILPNGDAIRIDDDEDGDRFRSRKPRPKIIRLPNGDRVVKMPNGGAFLVDD